MTRKVGNIVGDFSELREGECLFMRKLQKKTKLVCGLGVNDADYPVTWIVHEIQPDGSIKRKRERCPIYQDWKDMLIRCKVGGRYQTKHPTYAGTDFCTEWKYFSKFKAWCDTQTIRAGYCLDKDLKIRGNKIYSPDFCTYVPMSFNLFMGTVSAKRGDYPLGVCWNEATNKFLARVATNGMPRKTKSAAKHLGYFTCPFEAHRAWQLGKIEVGEYNLRKPETRQSLDALNLAIVRIQDDYKNNLITEII